MKHSSHFTMLLAFVFLTSYCIANENQTETVAPVAQCTSDQSPWRDFDFWIGEWEVFDPNSNRKYGDNHVEKKENGCLILEQWKGVNGTTGISMNFYDPLQKQWRQVWQNAGIFVDYSGGLDDEGRMQLEGTIYYHSTGVSAPFRGRWTSNEDGSVLQQFWQYDSGSGEWNGWFQGLYKKQT